MADRAEVREWAQRRLLDLAEVLTPEGSEVRQLRAAGVGDHRIFALYPFEQERFEYPAPYAELLSSNHTSIIDPASFFRKSDDGDLASALNAADDASPRTSAPYLFDVLILTLERLTTDEPRTITVINPFTGEIAPRVNEEGRTTVLGEFTTVVDELCSALEGKHLG